MIIYENRRPVGVNSDNCVGVVGENLAFTQEFLVKDIINSNISFTIHIRFSDGSVNSIIPDSVQTTSNGTKVVWIVKKNDIFQHGYFELQLEGRNAQELIYQTDIITLYADESIPVEDREYENPNSETLALRQQTYELLSQIENQQSQIESNYETIVSTGIENKENISNKVSDKESVTNVHANYPSIQYMNDFYYDIEETYSSDDIDDLLRSKAACATTLEGYGITNALENSDGCVSSTNLANNAVTTEKIKAGAVTAIKICNNSISSKHIVDGQIISSKILDGAINSNKLEASLMSTINGKYNASNVESGTGTFTAVNQATASRISSATFNYCKVGSFVTVIANITMTEVTINKAGYLSLSGLPFINSNNFATGAAVSNANVPNNIMAYRINANNQLIVSAISTTSYADGEVISLVVTYPI